MYQYALDRDRDMC